MCECKLTHYSQCHHTIWGSMNVCDKETDDNGADIPVKGTSCPYYTSEVTETEGECGDCALGTPESQ